MSEPIQSIAQNNYILATQQEVSHDNTLSGNGTVDSQLSVVPGFNETVLWSGTYQGTGSITLSEALSNFDLVRIEWCPYTEASNWLEPKDSVTTKVFNNQIHLTGVGVSTNYSYQMLVNIALQVNDTSVSESYHASVTLHGSSDTGTLRGYKIYKIIGINRIANN